MQIVTRPATDVTLQYWQSSKVTERPRAEQRPYSITRHGDTRVDPYYWLMDRDNPEVLTHLRAENDYLAASLAPLRALEDTIFQEIKGRIVETDTSVPVKSNGWWYFERTREGLNYPIGARAPLTGDGTTPPVIDPDHTLDGEQVVLDENVEAGDSDFLSVGILSVSPDDRWVAVGTDFEGAERHTLTIRALDGQDPVSEEITNVYYGFAWAADSRHFFYTRVDDAMRPWQVWRHELGTPADADVLVFQEDDAQYNVGVGRSRNDAMVLIFAESSMTNEVHVIDAHHPTEEPRVLDPRRHGIEYTVEHYTNAEGEAWWLKITNEGATDFKLQVRRVEETEWRDLVGERPGNRLDGVDAFSNFLVFAERLEGAAAVRLVPLLESGDPFAGELLDRSRIVAGPEAPATIALGPNLDYVTTQVRVVMTSMVTPTLVADIVVATGERIVRKQQVVLGGYDPDQYVTWREWVSASDGARIPVSLVARRDVVNVDTAGAVTARGPRPCLLYGYGSYEHSVDPTFSAIRLSLLDRGIIFAIAHVRGGGEMGRSWYESGKLAQKPTTFSDFVRVGRALVDAGWTDSEHFAARGGSAGGLLMGAVMNLDPTLFHTVIAEVPFVDALTTMLDATLPLTIGEWEEWGNPDASATAYRTMKSYSPYDNVRSTNDDGTPRVYPHVYANGGLNDSRVGFWEPAKWVLRLRDANPDNVAYLKTEMGAGHAGPSGRYDTWRDQAQILAFVVSEISGSPEA